VIYVSREVKSGNVSSFEIGEQDEPRSHPQEWCDRRVCVGFWGQRDKAMCAVKALNQSKNGRFEFCPHCSERVVQPRSGDDYCEECGWPDEVRTDE